MKKTEPAKNKLKGPWLVCPDVLYSFKGDKYRFTSLRSYEYTYEFEGETAIAIWTHITGQKSFPEIVVALEKQFGSLSSTQKRWTQLFINELSKAGLITADI